MKCGVQMLSEALSWFKKVPLEAGYVVVLETAGRAGNWNPHLHILMTSGGVTPENRWREVSYFPFEELHKRWQYHLLTMLKHAWAREMKQQIDALWQKYPKGLVAYLEEGKVPAGGQGLAYYLAKYVVSPPISLRRILGYDGQHVRYWYHDHKSKNVKRRKSAGADVYWPDGAAYFAEGVSPDSLLRSACDVQTSTVKVLLKDLGGAGSGDQGDVSGRGAELPRAGVGQHGS